MSAGGIKRKVVRSSFTISAVAAVSGLMFGFWIQNQNTLLHIGLGGLAHKAHNMTSHFILQYV